MSFLLSLADRRNCIEASSQSSLKPESADTTFVVSFSVWNYLPFLFLADLIHWTVVEYALSPTNPFDIRVLDSVCHHMMRLSPFIICWSDEEKYLFVPDDTEDDYRMWRRYDYGKFYASKTFFDDKKQRRILWGWLNESDSAADDVAKGWSGIQTVPRVVTLDTNMKQLVQWPVQELESLRGKQTDLRGVELKTGDLVEVKGLKASEVDVEAEFELPNLKTAEPFDANWILDPAMLCRDKGSSVQGKIGPFGLFVLASSDLKEYTAISFRIFDSGEGYKVLMCSDQRRSSLRAEVYKPAYGAFVNTDIKKDGKISLKTLIDHSVVESFGAGGRTCIASRVYPTSLVRGDPRLYAFNNGEESVKISWLKAWNMAKSRIS